MERYEAIVVGQFASGYICTVIMSIWFGSLVDQIRDKMTGMKIVKLYSTRQQNSRQSSKQEQYRSNQIFTSMAKMGRKEVVQ